MCIELKKVWQVKWMPFDSRDINLINAKQAEWIQNGLFGMGWFRKNFNPGGAVSQTSFDEYLKLFDGDPAKKQVEKAAGNYKKMKKGDIIITRLKNGSYYAGTLKNGIGYNLSGDNFFSWSGRVDWTRLKNEEELPCEIVGKFSQRHQRTVQPINNFKLRLLIMGQLNSGIERNIKIRICKDNFCECMTYEQLEDVVASYIYKMHCSDGYVLLPSSCKASHVKYEFCFVKNNAKPITCQVKNQREIDINEYLNPDGYEKIYLFSGLWSDDYAEELQQRYKDKKHLVIIKRSDLYKFLLRDCSYIKEKLSKYHTFNPEMVDIGGLEKNIPVVSHAGEHKDWIYLYRLDSMVKRGKHFDFSEADNCKGICFNSNNLYYSFELGMLIKEGNVPETDVDFAKSFIKLNLSKEDI